MIHINLSHPIYLWGSAFFFGVAVACLVIAFVIAPRK